MIRLYHGSNVAIEQIDLSRSKRGKDFGQGFYLNANPDQAKAYVGYFETFLYTRNEYDKKHLLPTFFQNIVFVNPENFRTFAPFRQTGLEISNGFHLR